jgi:hypothetical protein
LEGRRVGLRLILSTMFLGVRNSQDISDLFARYFQGVYVNDVSVGNADRYVFEDASFSFRGCFDEFGRIYPSILRKIFFRCQG